MDITFQHFEDGLKNQIKPLQGRHALAVATISYFCCKNHGGADARTLRPLSPSSFLDDDLVGPKMVLVACILGV